MLVKPFRTPLIAAVLACAVTLPVPAHAFLDKLMQSISAGSSGNSEGSAGSAASAEATAATDGVKEPAKDLLTNLDLGEQLRLKRQFAESRDAWLLADDYVRAWEDEVKNSPEKMLQSLGEGLGSLLINDGTRRYDGADYERVALATRLTLSHLALGDWEKARTEVRKMHEREAIIADFRAKEVEALNAERAEKDVDKKETKDLNGYPVETIDNPEVTALRNSYQSAFGHYLAGFVYEQTRESSLASAGYRQAIELRPDVPLLQQALAGLDQRLAKKPSARETDVLLILEAGNIPQKTSTTIPLPVPTHNGLVIVPTSFPSMPAAGPNPMPDTVTIDGKPIAVALVTSYDSMARRELKDSMPGVITRGTIRSIAKGVINSEVQKRAGIFGSIISSVMTTMTEKADTRMWGSLPSHVALIRATLAPGKHTIVMGGVTGEFEVVGAHSIVALRHNSPADLLISAATTPKIEPADIPVELPPKKIVVSKKSTHKEKAK